eukprot:scaffold109727_cov32-Prasinocladus_malaysianus.AAC.1
MFAAGNFLTTGGQALQDRQHEWHMSLPAAYSSVVHAKCQKEHRTESIVCNDRMCDYLALMP